MRSFVLTFLLLSSAGFATAQNPAMQAAQTANDMAAMQATQQANMDTALAADNASRAASQGVVDMPSGGCLTPKPSFLLKAGSTYGEQLMFLTDKARKVEMFYTTDGWTPTPRSQQYEAPIVITPAMHVRVVAYEPGCGRSQIVDATSGSAGSAAPQPVALQQGGVLAQGTEIPLAFVQAVDSRTAKIGDPIQLRLASSFVWHGQEYSPKQVTATGWVTAVHPSASVGRPGFVTFSVSQLMVDGVAVPVHAIETAEGGDKFNKAGRAGIFFGFGALAVKGDDVEIAPGRVVEATVTADTALPRQAASIQ